MLEDAPFSIDGTHEGRSLLIAGPPMTGKYDLMFRLLAENADRGIIITTGDAAEDVRADFAEAAGVDPELVGVVDCVSRQRGASVTDSERVRYVSSPKNVTEIGMKFTDLFEVYREHGAPVGVGIHSLSELLMYLDPQDVYQFVRVLTKQAESEGWFTVSVIGSTMHDEQTLHTMYEPFDTVINTREQDGARELRVRDRQQTATAWTSF
ncbi:RAD55 family ATPase [Halobaculum sp. D14]|uniref:RAD55 family ATPase n=1 Tax=unclassified Halobaculum TaxID=2640896 RepID=UPI003EBA32AC